MADNCPLTPYTIDYQSRYKFGWFGFDIEARRELSQLEDGRWKLDFSAKASMANLQELSVFTCTDSLITPGDYLYRAGGVIDEDDSDYEEGYGSADGGVMVSRGDEADYERHDCN